MVRSTVILLHRYDNSTVAKFRNLVCSALIINYKIKAFLHSKRSNVSLPNSLPIPMEIKICFCCIAVQMFPWYLFCIVSKNFCLQQDVFVMLYVLPQIFLFTFMSTENTPSTKAMY